MDRENCWWLLYLEWIHLSRHLNAMFIFGYERKSQKAYYTTHTPSFESMSMPMPMSMSLSYETKYRTEQRLYRAYPNASLMHTFSDEFDEFSNLRGKWIHFDPLSKRNEMMNLLLQQRGVDWFIVKWMDTSTLAEWLNVDIANAEYHLLYTACVCCQKMKFMRSISWNTFSRFGSVVGEPLSTSCIRIQHFHTAWNRALIFQLIHQQQRATSIKHRAQHQMTSESSWCIDAI